MEPMSDPIFESVTTMDQPEFARWVASREGRGDARYELLNGRLVMNPPAGWPHGEVEARLVRRLGNAVEPLGLGRILGSSQGFELPSGDTLEPDASFVSTARWEASPPSLGRFLRVVPDLVAEILSPSTAARDRGEKKGAYARAGVREYWLVDPRARMVTVFGSLGDRFDRGRVYEDGETVESVVVPGLRIAVAELF